MRPMFNTLSLAWWVQGRPETINMVWVGLGRPTQTSRIIRRVTRRISCEEPSVTGSYTNLAVRLRLRELPLSSRVREEQKGPTFGGAGPLYCPPWLPGPPLWMPFPPALSLDISSNTLTWFCRFGSIIEHPPGVWLFKDPNNVCLKLTYNICIDEMSIDLVWNISIW